MIEIKICILIKICRPWGGGEVNELHVLNLQLSSLCLSEIFCYWKALIGSIVEKCMFTCLLKYAGCR